MPPRAPAERTLESAKADTVTELFPYEMPFRAARVIGLIIVLIFAAVTVGVVVIEAPETIVCPFVLAPETGASAVQAPVDGVIVEVRTAVTEEVGDRDVLFVIRSREVHEWQSELRAIEQEYRALDQRRSMFEDSHKARLESLEVAVAQRANEISFRRVYLDAYGDIAERMKKLSAQGLTSAVELLNHEIGLASARRDVALAEQEHAAAKLRLKEAEAEAATQRGELDIAADKAKVRADALADLLRDCERDTVLVRAPFSGSVLSLPGIKAGDVVTRGQELCQIARAGAAARARLEVAEEGIPRLKAGQRIRYYFDAFPYQRYGVVTGNLAWVSPAAVQSEQGTGFVALGALDADALSQGGESRPLRIGMRGTARISVGRRSLIEFVFEPLRQLRENVAPES